MAFELIDLRTKLKEGTIGDLSLAVKVVNRLKDIRSVISFPNLSNKVNDWKIVVFTDAALCNINNGTASTAGYIVWLMDCHGKCSPLSWHADKIKRVVRSTIAAEALSLQEGLESAFYYRKMLEDILGVSTKTIPIIAYVDNKSVIEAIYSTKLVDDKWLRVDIAAISQSLAKDEVSDQMVPRKSSSGGLHDKAWSFWVQSTKCSCRGKDARRLFIIITHLTTLSGRFEIYHFYKFVSYSFLFFILLK